MNNYFTALRGREAFSRFIDINKNPANSYRAGHEWVMDSIPRIFDTDTEWDKAAKLNAMHEIIEQLAQQLMTEAWPMFDWPDAGTMLNRVILGIDRETGAQLVLVRWNAIETPIHGHAYGQMLDYLIRGTAAEVEYDIVDADNRAVMQSGNVKYFFGPIVLSNDFYVKMDDVSRGALVHKFIPQTKCLTLHLIPELPRDGKDNLFAELKTSAVI